MRFFCHLGYNNFNLKAREYKIIIIKKVYIYWIGIVFISLIMDKIEQRKWFTSILLAHLKNRYKKVFSCCDTCQRTKRSNTKMVHLQISYLNKYHGINFVYI